jgi:hypothetical protein
MAWLTDLGINLLAAFIAFVIGVTVSLLAIKIKRFRIFLRKIGLHFPINRPQLDLDLSYDHKQDKTKVIIKNAGDQAAYNVYAFLFEVFHGTENKTYTVSSLGNESIRAGILAPGEKVTFEGKNIKFDGCNITAEQEMWVEYTDEVGDHYRTKVIPPSPRGDDLKVEVPFKISHRMPRLPGLRYEGAKDYEIIQKGRGGLPNLPYL